MSTRQKIAVVVLLVLYLLPIWFYPLFPSQDGPSHLYNTVIFSDLMWNPKSFFADFYTINWRPFPNWTFTVLASLFYPLLPIVTVEKIILSVYLVGFVCSVFYFLRSISTDKTTLGFGAFLFSYNWFLLMGFYNFCLSIPLALFTIGYCLRHRGAIHVRRAILLMALFIVLYFSHVVSFGVVLITLVFLFGCFGQRRLRALVQVGLCALPAIILLSIYVLTQPHVAVPRYHAPIDWLAASTLTFKIGPWFEGMETIWFVGFWCVLGFLIFQSWSQFKRWLPEERIWWWVVGGILALSLLLPYNLLGGDALNERLSLFVGLFLLAALSLRASNPSCKWIGAVFGLLVVAQLAYVHVAFWNWNHRLASFEKSAPKVMQHATVLPLVFAENEIGFYVNPFLHADSYVLERTKSVSPTNYEGYRDYFPVSYKTTARLAAPTEWFKPRTFLDRDMARHYEYVLLWKADTSVQHDRALRDFEEVFSEADLRVLKHR